MGKSKRTVIGSVIKSNDAAKPNYIKFNIRNGSLVIKDKQTVSVESKNYQLASLQKAMDAGKISAEVGAMIEERISKIPDWVLGEIILVEKPTT